MSVWQCLIDSSFKKFTTPPRVSQVDPWGKIHRSPRVHMRQQTCERPGLLSKGGWSGHKFVPLRAGPMWAGPL